MRIRSGILALGLCSLLWLCAAPVLGELVRPTFYPFSLGPHEPGGDRIRFEFPEGEDLLYVFHEIEAPKVLPAGTCLRVGLYDSNFNQVADATSPCKTEQDTLSYGAMIFSGMTKGKTSDVAWFSSVVQECKAGE